MKLLWKISDFTYSNVCGAEVIAMLRKSVGTCKLISCLSNIQGYSSLGSLTSLPHLKKLGYSLPLGVKLQSEAGQIAWKC